MLVGLMSLRQLQLVAVLVSGDADGSFPWRILRISAERVRLARSA